MAAFAVFQPLANAATGHYEAMVLGCIDPRLQEPVAKYTAQQGLTRQYSQFVFAVQRSARSPPLSRIGTRRSGTISRRRSSFTTSRRSSRSIIGIAAPR